MIALGYFLCAVFFNNRVIRYVLKHILVIIKTNFGYVLGKILVKMHKTDITILEKYGERDKIYMVTYIEISMKLGLLNLNKVCFGG